MKKLHQLDIPIGHIYIERETETERDREAETDRETDRDRQTDECIRIPFSQSRCKLPEF